MQTLSESLKSFVRETLRELQYALFLTEWNVDIHYMDGPHVDSPQVAGEMKVNHKYFDATITIYPLFLEKNEEEQREILTHEMCHIYTEPYKEMWERQANGVIVTRHEESITNERLTSLIERLASDAFKDRLAKITMVPSTKKRKGVK